MIKKHNERNDILCTKTFMIVWQMYSILSIIDMALHFDMFTDLTPICCLQGTFERMVIWV